MTEPRVETQVASDGYPIHVAVWPAPGTAAGPGGRPPRRPEPRRLVSHAGPDAGRGGLRGPLPRPPGLGRPTAATGATPPRPAGWSTTSPNGSRRSATPSPPTPIALAGISWGGKLAVITAAEPSRAGRRPGPDLPGPAPAGRRLARRAAADRLGLLHEPPQDVPDPPERPRPLHRQPRGPGVHRRRPASACTRATAGLLAASAFIDRRVRRRPAEGPPARPADARRPGPDRRQRPDPATTSSDSPAATARSSSIPKATTPWSSSPTRRATPAT